LPSRASYGRSSPTHREAKTDKLLTILDTLSLERDSQPRVLLPEVCPTVDDPEVRAAIGKVSTARGADNDQGKVQCLYRNAERDRTLRMAGPIPRPRGRSGSTRATPDPRSPFPPAAPPTA
jgi:hypothetical protein